MSPLVIWIMTLLLSNSTIRILDRINIKKIFLKLNGIFELSIKKLENDQKKKKNLKHDIIDFETTNVK